MLWVLFLSWLVFFVISWFPKTRKFKKSSSKLSIYYGAPGSGKTTLAAWYAARALNSGVKVYSNVPIKGCYEITKADIGHFDISDGLLIFDEAGVDYNNRNFKANFDQASLEWWKKHRHENVECMVFSQGFDDMDKKIRGLATHMYIVRRLGHFVISKKIRKKPDIDELTKQPIDAYYFAPFCAKWHFAPCVWKMFDSFEKLGLQKKDYAIYGELSEGTPSDY